MNTSKSLDDKLILDILNYAIARVEIRKPPDSGAIFPIYGKEVIDYAKQAIVEAVEGLIIGEDETKPTSHANKTMLEMEWHDRQVRNHLRAEQRKAIKEWQLGSSQDAVDANGGRT